MFPVPPPPPPDASLSLATLPDALLSAFFFSGYLDSLFVLRTLTRVSKRLSSIASTTVTSLDLRLVPGFRAGACALVARSYANLQALSADYCEAVDDAALEKLAALSHSLRTLSLKGCDVRTAGLKKVLPALKNLQLLDVSKVSKAQSTQVCDVALETLAASCPRLQVLRVAWCRRVTSRGVRALAKLTQLKVLDLDLCGMEDEEACGALGRMYLKELNLSGNPGVGNRGIKLIVKPSDVRGRQEEERDYAESCASISPSSTSSVARNSSGGGSSVGGSSSSFSGLLAASGAPARSPSSCSSPGGPDIDPADVTHPSSSLHLARKCELTHLWMRFLPKVSTSGLETVARQATKLLFLDISYCENVCRNGDRGRAAKGELNSRGCELFCEE